jgi:hypothetical protein
MVSKAFRPFSGTGQPPRDFQGFALKIHKSSEAIRKPILFCVEEDTPNNGAPPLNNTL